MKFLGINLTIGRLTLPNFQVNYKARINKTIWQYREDRYTDQQNRKESPDIDPQIYSQLIFNTACKGSSVEKTVFSTDDARINEYPYGKKLSLSSCHIENLKMDHKTKCKT